MNIIGKHYDGLVVEDTKGIFGGQHCILEISAVKSRAFNGLVVRADGCEYEKTPFGTSVGMELLGKHKNSKVMLLRWKRKNQKKIDAARGILEANIGDVFNTIANFQNNVIDQDTMIGEIDEIFGQL